MNFYLNKLTVDYCFESKDCMSFEILPSESPYYNIKDMENEELIYRDKYIDLCLDYACKVWNACEFSNNLVVIYEDKYNNSKKGENEFVKNCLEANKSDVFKFEWTDEEEKYFGTRYIFETNKINIKKLFRKILISDMGDNTNLDCAVYIIDKETDNVFFLYDDRGIHVFSNDFEFIKKLNRIKI